MKITSSFAALVAVLGLALASTTVSAQTTTATGSTTASTTAKPKATRYSGVLSAVDPSGTSFTITDKTQAPRTFSVTPTTKIKKDGKATKITDLKVGDKVGGSYTTDASGKLTATTINDGVSAKKAAAKTTATGTTTPAAQ